MELLRRFRGMRVFRSQPPSAGIPPNHTLQRARRKRRPLKVTVRRIHPLCGAGFAGARRRPLPDSSLRSVTIEKLGMAVFPSLAMPAGMELDVFTPLGNGPLRAAEITDALDVSRETIGHSSTPSWLQDCFGKRAIVSQTARRRTTFWCGAVPAIWAVEAASTEPAGARPYKLRHRSVRGSRRPRSISRRCRRTSESPSTRGSAAGPCRPAETSWRYTISHRASSCWTSVEAREGLPWRLPRPILT